MKRHGLPIGLRQDAWWLEPAEAARGATNVQKTQVNWPLLAAIFAGIALSDFMFWEGGAGLAMIFFTQGITVLALWLSKSRVENKTAALYCATSLLSALPWFVFPQFSAFLFLVFGHLAIIGHALSGRWDGFALRFATAWVPLSFVAGFWGTVETFTTLQNTKIKRSALQDAILPLSTLLVFGLLFMLANPIIENQVDAMIQLELPDWLIPRTLFWGAIGFILLPLLWINRFSGWTSWTIPTPSRRLHGSQRAITSTLLVSNAVFALQMGLDISILLAGTNLPDGMTYAQYAHRGAYPLVVTALLAIGFMLLARDHAQNSNLTKALLFLWIFQNAMLLGAAGYRLALYIDVYGLTYMRFYGAVGMVWVMIALAFMVVLLTTRLRRYRMIQGLGVIAVATVYGFSLTNVAQFIASQNLKMSVQKSDPDWLDRSYLCGLMPHAIGALNQHISLSGYDPLGDFYWPDPRSVKNWRGWSYRMMKIKAATTRYEQL